MGGGRVERTRQMTELRWDVEQAGEAILDSARTVFGRWRLLGKSMDRAVAEWRLRRETDR